MILTTHENANHTKKKMTFVNEMILQFFAIKYSPSNA